MNEMTHAELVRLAVVAVREDGGTKTAAELTALADRLEGGVIVPREPTEAMCKAGADLCPDTLDPQDCHNIYRAMLTASETK